MPNFSPKVLEMYNFGLYNDFYGILGWLFGGNAPKFGYYGKIEFQLSILHTLESRMPNFSPKVPKMTNFGLYSPFLWSVRVVNWWKRPEIRVLR